MRRRSRAGGEPTKAQRRKTATRKSRIAPKAERKVPAASAGKSHKYRLVWLVGPKKPNEYAPKEAGHGHAMPFIDASNRSDRSVRRQALCGLVSG